MAYAVFEEKYARRLPAAVTITGSGKISLNAPIQNGTTLFWTAGPFPDYMVYVSAVGYNQTDLGVWSSTTTSRDVAGAVLRPASH